MIKKKNKKILKKLFLYPSNSRVSSSRKQMKRPPLFNREVRHLLKWLTKTYHVPIFVLSSSECYIQFLEHMNKHKGLESAIRRIKEDRLSVTHFLSGSPRKVNGLTYDGIPTKLRTLIPIIRGQKAKELRFILTIMTGLRRFYLPLQPDIQSVISESKAGYYEWIFKYLPRFCRQICRLLPMNLQALTECKFSGKFRKTNLLKIPSWQGYHLTTKSSPSGKQALVNSLNELVILPLRLIESLKAIGGVSFSNKIDLCHSHAEELSRVINLSPLQPVGCFRRLAYIPDSEGKTRIIAMGDYWSQTVLKPLHDYLNKVLSRIPQDQTFNQGQGLSSLPFSSNVTYYSVDLSAFTDRFPIKILFGFLDYNFGRTYALAWYDILCGYSFDYKSPQGLMSNIRYSVGNPMGFYSSWPLTTLCHHFIVFVACQEIGISWHKAPYKLLGDDIIIWSDDLALKYKELITLIGVDISEQKSHTGTNLFEFAKRYFTPMGEISPFSIKAGLIEHKSYIGFFELLSHNFERNWSPCISPLEAARCFYNSKPNRFRSKDRNRQALKINFSLHIHKRLKGYDSDLTYLNNMLSYTDYPKLSCNQFHTAKAVFNQCIVVCFESAASSYYGDLQFRLENGLLHFTSYEDESLVDALYAHPYAYVYGKYVEEMYLSVMQKAWDFDALESGEWLPYFRTLKVADSNIIFSDRNYVRSTSSSPLLIREVRKSIYQLGTSPYL